MIDQHIDRVLERALAIGPATFGVVQTQASTHKHQEETLRSAQGILRSPRISRRRASRRPASGPSRSRPAATAPYAR